MNELPKSNDSFVEYRQGNSHNQLAEYIYSLSPEIARELSRLTPEAFQVVQGNVAGMLGNLPPQMFQTTVTSDAENLKQLLLSAMVTGYFLKSAESRMEIERSLSTEK